MDKCVECLVVISSSDLKVMVICSFTVVPLVDYVGVHIKTNTATPNDKQFVAYGNLCIFNVTCTFCSSCLIIFFATGVKTNLSCSQADV